MLDQGYNGVGGDAHDDHGEEVHARHQRAVAELCLEIQCDPEVQDREGETAEAEDGDELLYRVV